MKKLLLSFVASFVGVFSMMALGIEATINGEPVTDGATYELKCEKMPVDFSDWYRWDPELMLRSLDGKVNIEFTMSTPDDGFTVCWPSMCRTVTPGETFFATGEIGESLVSMQLHREFVFEVGSVPPEETATAEVKIYDEEGETLSFTLVCLGVSADVKTIMQGASEGVVVMGTDGIRVSDRAKGLVIVRNSDGTFTKEIR